MIIVGDIHFKESYNIRKDDIVDTLINKLEQIVKIAKEKKDNTIIFLGDLFDSFTISNLALYKIIEFFKKHNKTIDFFTSYGNHDEKNNSKDLREETVLNLLFSLGVIKYSEEYNNTFNTIWNVDYLDNFKEYTSKLNLPQILCGHLFYENKKFGGIEHNLTKEDVIELGERGVKHLILGHDHKDYPLEKLETKNGIIYVHRPGALIRKDIKKYNFERDIKVLYINNKNIEEFEYIKLNVEQFINVISNKKLYELKEEEIGLEEFEKDVSEEIGLLDFLNNRNITEEENEKEVIEYVEQIENDKIKNKIRYYLRKVGI